MKVLDLFSGIGGFSLGLEAAGMQTVAFCEREPFCQAVLKKHWPDIPCHDDVKTLDGKQYNGTIDVIAGGFPCQDISLAGKGAGLAGERSGLWFEYLRIIKEAQPRYVIIENVSALRSRGLEEVLRSLAEIGYDAEWHCIPASAIGAPHRRDRVWIVAYAAGSEQQRYLSRELHQQERIGASAGGENIRQENRETSSDIVRSNDKTLADADSARCLREGQAQSERRERHSIFAGRSEIMAYPNGERGRLWNSQWQDAEDAWQSSRCSQFGFWDIEPNVGRVANGIPLRVHRLKSLGNSIVPQIAQIIGEAIIEYERKVA